MCAMQLKIGFLIIIVFVIHEIFAEECLTPEKDKGLCVPLYECPKLLKEFVVPPKGTENYFRQYICENSGEVKVCCGISLNFTVPLDQHLPSFDMASGTYAKDALFHCIHKTTVDKVLPIVRAKNEFGAVITNCRAVAINSVYLITLARCVVPNNKTKNFTVLGIRLVMEKQKRSDDFDIEEVIPHPFYDSANGLNDLAILKLSVPLSADDVAFHCMLDRYVSPNIKNAQAVYGNNSLNSVRLMPIEECKQIFHDQNITIAITEYDICVRDVINTTDENCNKYGLPLISHYNNPLVYGISSFKSTCGDGLPDVYKNVGRYTDWILENVEFRVDSGEQCTTPNKEAGRCRYMNRCPSVLQMFTETKKITEAHLRGYICKQAGYREFISVCCPQSPNSSNVKDIYEQKINDIPEQFLESKRCGLQHRDDYFADDQLAIDEYPWMALIIRSSETGPYCTGVLINARYVLATADCAKEPIDDITVRLGDYTRLNNTDCIVDKKIGYADCTDTEIFGVEEVVPHPFFIWAISYNDIGLLRLNKTVSYSDYIRPICLPIQGTPVAKVGDTLYMSNWILFTHRRYRENSGNIKTKVTAKVITNNKCQVMFRKKGFIHSSHMCALIDESNNTNETIHAVFYGGGLMFQNNYRWHIEGIPQLRVLDNTPIISGNVSHYVNWILDNMRPW